uniref:Uncharacterized protein n=1 Tax=Oryza brachyantha TaxID=4533 RepID=J3MHC8_ORYBR
LVPVNIFLYECDFVFTFDVGKTWLPACSHFYCPLCACVRNSTTCRIRYLYGDAHLT